MYTFRANKMNLVNMLTDDAHNPNQLPHTVDANPLLCFQSSFGLFSGRSYSFRPTKLAHDMQHTQIFPLPLSVPLSTLLSTRLFPLF